MSLFVLACLLPAFAVSCLVTAAMRVLAPRWGLVDRPGARKVHEVVTPLGGGIGIWCGVVLPLAGAQLVCWWLARQASPPAWLPAELALHVDGVLHRAGWMWTILGAGTLLAATGLLDDARNLPWPPRLGVQVLVAVFLVAAGVRGTVFVPLPWVGRVLTVLWILVLVNSFNFLDNMDGLSGGIALVASLLFARVMLVSIGEPRWLVGGTLLVLAGSLGGFLVHNAPPARIFMGDCGSYFVGMMLATTTVLGTFYEPTMPGRHVMLAPLCILAIPLYDICSVVLIRLSKGLSPFQPDKRHFSHRLVELGLSRPNAVRTIWLATLATGLGALVLYEVPGWPAAWLVVAMVACLLSIVAILEWHGLRLERRREAAEGDRAGGIAAATIEGGES